MKIKTATAKSEFAFLRTALQSQENLESNEPARQKGVSLEAMHVPMGLSYVSIGKHGRARITKESPKNGPAFVLEPVGSGTQSAVLVFPMPGHTAHANGMPTPLVAAVRPRDCVQLDGSDEVLHGTRYIDNTIGPFPKDALPAKCPICLSAFEADARVWFCRCGQPLHLETETVENTSADREPLQCAMLTSTCPNCGEEVAASEEAKYTYIPSHFQAVQEH